MTQRILTVVAVVVFVLSVPAAVSATCGISCDFEWLRGDCSVHASGDVWPTGEPVWVAATCVETCCAPGGPCSEESVPFPLDDIELYPESSDDPIEVRFESISGCATAELVTSLPAGEYHAVLGSTRSRLGGPLRLATPYEPSGCTVAAAGSGGGPGPWTAVFVMAIALLGIRRRWSRLAIGNEDGPRGHGLRRSTGCLRSGRETRRSDRPRPRSCRAARS